MTQIVFDCFAVHWGDVMFRLTGWNKLDEILSVVWACCFSAANGAAAPSSGLNWTQSTDITKGIFIPRHIMFRRTMKDCKHGLASFDYKQIWSLKTPLHSNAQKQQVGIIALRKQLQNILHHGIVAGQTDGTKKYQRALDTKLQGTDGLQIFVGVKNKIKHSCLQ